LNPVEFIRNIKNSLPEIITTAVKIVQVERKDMFSEEELKRIVSDLENGEYKIVFKGALTDIFLGAFVFTPLGWGLIALSSLYNLKIGASLLIYESIPILGGIPCLIQVTYLFRRSFPVSFSYLRKKNFPKALATLILPVFAFGDVNWILGTIAVNAARLPLLSKLFAWLSLREVKIRVQELKNKFRRKNIKT